MVGSVGGGGLIYVVGGGAKTRCLFVAVVVGLVSATGSEGMSAESSGVGCMATLDTDRAVLAAYPELREFMVF